MQEKKNKLQLYKIMFYHIMQKRLQEDKVSKIIIIRYDSWAKQLLSHGQV